MGKYFLTFFASKNTIFKLNKNHTKKVLNYDRLFPSFNSVDPDPYSEYRSRKLLNTDPDP